MLSHWYTHSMSPAGFPGPPGPVVKSPGPTASSLSRSGELWAWLGTSGIPPGSQIQDLFFMIFIWYCHWIGLRENLQETMVFTIKYI